MVSNNLLLKLNFGVDYDRFMHQGPFLETINVALVVFYVTRVSERPLEMFRNYIFDLSTVSASTPITYPLELIRFLYSLVS